ncbi:hypothetical protein [Streptomyces sp. NPDC048825]
MTDSLGPWATDTMAVLLVSSLLAASGQARQEGRSPGDRPS